MKKQHLASIAALTGCTALAIHGINKLIFYTANLKDFLSDSNGNYYDWRFGKVFYKTYGSGSPLLLIHDLSAGGSGYEWHRLVEGLAESHTVYVVDLPGCGRSEKTNITYTSYIYVQFISDFIKNVIKHKTTVAATGLSASFIIMACFANGDLFDKLIFINPSNIKELSQSPTKSTKTLKVLLDAPIIGTLIYNMLAAKNMIEEDFEDYYFYDTSKIKLEYINQYYEAAHKHGARAKFLLSSIKGRYLNINIIHALKQLNHSIYILSGEAYNPGSEDIEDYLNCNSSIETYIIPNTKYLPQLESPKAVIEQIQLFTES